MENPLDFTGKVVLVTGSSRGIGAEMIKAFGKRGATCVVNYFTDPKGENKADAEKVAKELKDPLVINCDVIKRKKVKRLMNKFKNHNVGLNILLTIPEFIANARTRKWR